MTTVVTVSKYRVYCVTEAAYKYVWAETEPTSCPTDPVGDTIDASQTAVVDKVSRTDVTANEPSSGPFLVSSKTISVPAGSPGDVTTHDFSFPYPINLWHMYTYPTTTMAGDSMDFLISPALEVGTITASVAAAATLLAVTASVFDSVVPGVNVSLDDTVNTDDLGVCLTTDKAAGEITVETATANAFAIGDAVQTNLRVVKDFTFRSTAMVDFGKKGFRGKQVNAGEVLRVLYTNNEASAKTWSLNLEMYLQ